MRCVVQESTALVRFGAAGEASAALERANAGDFKVGERTGTVALLEGQPEQDFAARQVPLLSLTVACRVVGRLGSCAWLEHASDQHITARCSTGPSMRGSGRLRCPSHPSAARFAVLGLPAAASPVPVTALLLRKLLLHERVLHGERTCPCGAGGQV